MKYGLHYCTTALLLVLRSRAVFADPQDHRSKLWGHFWIGGAMVWGGEGAHLLMLKVRTIVIRGARPTIDKRHI